MSTSTSTKERKALIAVLVKRCKKEFGFKLRSDLPSYCKYWLCHHEILHEFVNDPYERIAYVIDNKPKWEVPTRLHEFRPIKGRLGSSKAYAEWKKAEAEWSKAYAEWKKAYAAWRKTIKPGEAERLHEKEVPRSKWNGRTIFP